MRILRDKMSVVVVSAAVAQIVWLAGMMMLWAWVFDASGDSMLLSVAAVALSVATAARWAKPLSRLAVVGLQFADLPLWESLAALMTPDGERTLDARELSRVFGSAVIVATVGSLVSMVLAFLTVRFVGVMSDRFLFIPFDWGVLKLLTQWVAMFPLAVGMVAMVGAGNAVCRNTQATGTVGIFGCWLLAIALGMAGFALAWWLGVDMLPLSMLMACVMSGLATLSFWRPPAMNAYQPPVPPATRIGWRDTCKNIICFTILALVLIVQMRLLGDLVGVAMIGRVLWVAGSLGLLAVGVKLIGRESAPADINETVGVAIGVVATLGGQMALTSVGRVDPRLFFFGCFSGIMMQIPLVMLAARLIVHRRQGWVLRDGSLMGFLAVGAVGSALGIGVYLLGGLLQSNWLVPLVVMAIGLGATGLGARRASGRSLKALWLVNGAVLMVSTILIVAMPMMQLGREYGRPSRGIWLSLFEQQSPGSENLWQPESSLPYPRTWRSQSVTAAMEEVFIGRGIEGPPSPLPQKDDARRGRWWVIATSHRDRPDGEHVPGVYVAQSVPDPTALPSNYERSFLMLGSEGNYLAASQVGQGLFDGLLLAPLPADHPEAWRCYNEKAISRCVRRIQPGGVVMLRTQVSGDNTQALVAVAETFNRVVGPSWGVVEFHENVIDLLLIGPRRWGPDVLVERPTDQVGVIVFPSEFIQDDRMHVRPIQILHPQGLWRGRLLSYSRLQARLDNMSGHPLPEDQEVAEVKPE